MRTLQATSFALVASCGWHTHCSRRNGRPAFRATVLAGPQIITAFPAAPAPGLPSQYDVNDDAGYEDKQPWTKEKTAQPEADNTSELGQSRRVAIPGLICAHTHDDRNQGAEVRQQRAPKEQASQNQGDCAQYPHGRAPKGRYAAIFRNSQTNVSPKSCMLAMASWSPATAPGSRPTPKFQ